MVKTINIGGKNYDLKSSAFTVFAYKDQMGRDLLKDISSINDLYNDIQKLPEEKQESAWLNKYTDILETILNLAYIMIKEQDKSFKEYKEWLKDLDKLSVNPNWIMEILEIAISPFQG